jgi:hypothetical protein
MADASRLRAPNQLGGSRPIALIIPEDGMSMNIDGEHEG